MAKPHNKTLLGPEGGGKSQHWYDFIESRRSIKRSLRWDGGCPNSKPGVAFVVAESLFEKTKEA
jgi:hypothetical protein